MERICRIWQEGCIGMRHIDKNQIEERLQRSYPLSGRWHNGFHLEMPFGLINDPNGLVFANRQYHIFFQWNPLGCEHKNKCWAYTKTEDFVHYSRPRLAMQPTDAHDKDGCYSGCGFEEEGVRILYTCNAKDEAGVRTPAQRLGTLLPDGTIEKDEVIVPEEAAGYTAHFRDPYMFVRDGRRYFVLGAQNEALQGRAVVYREAAVHGEAGRADSGNNGGKDFDSGAWEFLGEVKTAYEAFGYMWECPNLLQFTTEDVLLFCPQGLEAEKYAFQNRYQSGYISGRLKLDSMVLEHGEFRELDRGFDFYAPQVLAKDGRYIMFGWMGMPEEEALYPSAEDGWLFSLTVPRELTLQDGVLYQKPVAELSALRKQTSERQVREISAYEYQALLPELCEAKLAIYMGNSDYVKLLLAYGDERLMFCYDRLQQIMTIDRSGMKQGAKGMRHFKLAAEEVLKLHLLVDRSAVEVFFQDGREAASMLIFPATQTAPRLILQGNDKLSKLEGSIWELSPHQYI